MREYIQMQTCEANRNGLLSESMRQYAELQMESMRQYTELQMESMRQYAELQMESTRQYAELQLLDYAATSGSSNDVFSPPCGFRCVCLKR